MQILVAVVLLYIVWLSNIDGVCLFVLFNIYFNYIYFFFDWESWHYTTWFKTNSGLSNIFLFYCNSICYPSNCYLSITKNDSEAAILAPKLESIHRKYWEVLHMEYLHFFNVLQLKQNWGDCQQTFFLTFVHVK